MSRFELPSYEGVAKGSEIYKEIVGERANIRREALAIVTDLILNNQDDFEGVVIDAAKCLLPQNRTETKMKLNAKTREVYDMFDRPGRKVGEDILWEDYKYGRHEMKGFCKDMIRKPDVADRKWVSFDPIKGFYKLEKIGSEPPRNWMGFVPPYKQI